MTVASADLHKSLVTVWISSGLDALIKSYWSAGDQTQYNTLNDGEAAPGTPFPYCVFEQVIGAPINRMSGPTGLSKYMIRGVPFLFRIHAGKLENNARSAKQLASDIVEEILKVYGGHPLQAPVAMVLDNGGVLNQKYVNDYGIRTGDSEYLWTIEYEFTTDVAYVTG